MTESMSTLHEKSRFSLERNRATVIHRIPSNKALYIGSPSIAKLAEGVYVASHDYFGPESTEFQNAVTDLFRSDDHGKTWHHLKQINEAFWSNLFVHRGSLYLFGTNRHHGQIVIRRSADGGHTWSTPCDASSGLLTESGEYHTAPVPVLSHAGRLWRAVENAGGGTEWGFRYRPLIMSISDEADLLKRQNWEFTLHLEHDRSWLGGRFGGWLEGNACATPEGKIVNILRVDHPLGGKAALAQMSHSRSALLFDPTSDFINFPGAATKFTIRHDAVSGHYYSLVNEVPPQYTGPNAALTRNTLTLTRSRDLLHWELRCIVSHHPDREQHGFQYADWIIDGDDLVAAVRTGDDDEFGGAHKAHDANFLTFHRVPDFRNLSLSDSVVDPHTLGY